MLDILLVDDEPSLRLSVGDALESAGHTVVAAIDGQAALELLEETDFDLVVSDIRMPRVDGITLFHAIRKRAPGTDVILVTAYGDVTDAVGALQAGASDYMTKPFAMSELIGRVARVDLRRGLQNELAQARAQLTTAGPETKIIGNSRPVRQMLTRIDTIAVTDARVLIVGETGTGKELVARRLHALSARSDKPFVPVHCAAFPETLIESELFGHVRGAFTGASRNRDGRFVRANGGTLFLDEIAEISLPVQAKLLRVLQDGMIEPIGADRSVSVEVRVISATHRNLREMVEAGTFREDLYYRLNVIDIEVPPLRARRGDLSLLVEHFLLQVAGPDKDPSELSILAWSALEAHPFPGNIRELEHAIQHASILAGSRPILPLHLPRAIAGDLSVETEDTTLIPLSEAVRAFERAYLQRALQAASGKKAKTAEALGISRKNLWEKLKSHGLD